MKRIHQQGVHDMLLKGSVVNVLGDSITEGVGASCRANRFTDVLCREYELKAVNNYGISGTRIARQQKMTAERHERWFASRIEEMDPAADAVVVFGGTNLDSVILDKNVLVKDQRSLKGFESYPIFIEKNAIV